MIALEPASGRGPAPSETLYLHPGGLVVSVEPLCVTTILGSCVSVCLWDARLELGGLNHFVLPHEARAGLPTPQRYGNLALRALLDGLLALGSRPADLRARVYGGACVLAAFRGRERHLGAANVAVARRFLAQAGIPIVAQDTGGERGRRLVFHTRDGSAQVSLL